MHNAAYQALGLPWEYSAADCADEEGARRFLQSSTWAGLNVTRPYKFLAYQLAHAHTQAALVSQGANVLVRRGDEILADNTDGSGCVAYLDRCGVSLVGKRVVVCATGPTAQAIACAALGARARRLTLLGRDRRRAAQVMEGLSIRCAREGLAFDSELLAGSYESHSREIAAADVIIDASPLGMKQGDPAPFCPSLLSGGQVVLDVVYGHGQSALLAGAQRAGCRAFDGSGMLVAQAVETVRDFVDWLSIPVDLGSVDLFPVMARAAGFPAL